MKSEEIKLEIVRHYDKNVKGTVEDPVSEVFEDDVEKGQSYALNPKNWKRIIKEKLDDITCKASGWPINSIERVFDLAPADDQIRAYAITCPDGKLLYVSIQGE